MSLLTARQIITSSLVVLLISGCGNSEAPDPIPISQITGPASILPAVNPAFEQVLDVAVAEAAAGPYVSLPATRYAYDPADETLVLIGVPQAAGLYVSVAGTVADTRYIVYTHAHGNHAVAANELTSLAVGLVAAGDAARFDEAVSMLAADPLLGVNADAIAAPVRAAVRDPALTRMMQQLALAFVATPQAAHDHFQPGVHDVRALLETTERYRSIALGALAYDRWWLADAGGTGQLPSGEPVADYVRCKSCHGWDQLGLEGGYVRRTRTNARPNAGLGDRNAVSRNISRGGFDEDAVVHTGRGRSWTEGSGSWDGADMGFSTGNQHPDYSTADGLTAVQTANLLAFLNHPGARADTVFAQIHADQEPVGYSLVPGASGERGRDYYAAFCAGCHAQPQTDSTEVTNGLPGTGGLLAFVADDGKPSEFMHKMRWGIPGSTMTRTVMGYPSARDVADVLKYLEDPNAVPPPGGSDDPAVAAGRAKYDGACAACHKAGSYDPAGPYSDLAGRGTLLVADLGSSDPAMAGITLTSEEIAQLAAFLDALSGVTLAANNDNGSTERDTPATIDVLANDIGSGLSIVAWDALTAHGGTVSCAASCRYTPAQGYIGSDRFDYTISDGTRSATATVTLVVRAPGSGGDVNAGRLLYDNDCAACHRAGAYDPVGQNSDMLGARQRLVADLGSIDAAMSGTVLSEQQLADLRAFIDSLSGVTFSAVDDTASTTQDAAVTIDVLANDVGTALSISAWDALSAQGGAVSCAADCSYTPPAGFTGTDWFTYTLSDGSNTGVATVTVIVRAPGSGADVNAGRIEYDSRCAVCHSAGDYDTQGPNSDLAVRSSLLIADLGSYDTAMSGITLTQQQIADLAAFLDSLGANPTTPQEKYDAYCSSCHGPEGRGGSGGSVRGESASEIAEAIAEEREMNLPSLNALTAEDLQDIARYLGGGSDD